MTTKFESLSKLKCGDYDYIIKVRVIRLWRWASKTGEDYKSFNVMLLDNKRNKMHAFIPARGTYELDRKLKVGHVYIISNFTAQAYKATEIFRCLRNENQLIFSKDTNIHEIEDTGTNIPPEMFDFYDHTDLMSLTNQTTYLADVVGVIKDREIILAKFTNKNGQPQEQAKFHITDGCSNLSVTFWDRFAASFVQAFWETTETPVIIIIANCRVGLWNDEINPSNVNSTCFYLNYKHHSVVQLRRMLSDKTFADKVLAAPKKKKAELLTITELLSLGKESIEVEVITHVNILFVNENQKWFLNVCTTCDSETEVVEKFFICRSCNRIVPNPDKRFRFTVVASDPTGTIEVLLHDREVRMIIGKRVRELLPHDYEEGFFPDALKLLAQKPYTIKLEITDANVIHHLKLYWATNICIGYKLDNTISTEMGGQTQQSTTICTTEASTSTYNLAGMADLKCDSSGITKD